MKKKTVIHIIPRFYSGGAERLVLEYLKRLDKNKYNLHVASCVEDGELRQEFEKIENINIFVGSRKKHGGRWMVWKALKKYLDDIEPDIIHTHLLSSDTIGFLYKIKTKKFFTWIVTLHNVEQYSPLLYKIVWYFILKKADKVIAVAPKVASYAQKVFSVSSKKILLILNGIDLKKWSDVVKKKIFTSKNFVFATIGRLELQKGHKFLLEALSQLSFDNWEYHVYGDGSLEKELKERAKKLNIENKIIWHGLVSNIQEEVKKVDLVIQPSLWEGLSLVVMEAMASGRCVLVTDMSGDGLVENNKTGYIVENGNSEVIKEKIEYIIKNKEQAFEIADNAYKYSAHHFDIQKNIDSIEFIYDHS